MNISLENNSFHRKVKQPFSKHSRILTYTSAAVFIIALSLQYCLESSLPGLTDWICYAPPALFIVSLAFFQYTSLSSFKITPNGIAHKTFFGKTIRVIKWEDIKTFEIASQPAMRFNPVYILVSDSSFTTSAIRAWLNLMDPANSNRVFAIPYSPKAFRAISQGSPITCGYVPNPYPYG
ncbi:MAG: hypothetical protein FWG30_09630 [Eubacteriaceae bacterium]|nr:hypothetical protein [Eubacteriaceae bacterium]